MYLTILDYSTSLVSSYFIEEQKMETIDNRDDTWFIKELGYDPEQCSWMFHHFRWPTPNIISK